jgi:acyl-coenzyme A synthetase/AMP-(fatty) acid ligase
LAEAAVPSPEAIRWNVPKAFITLKRVQSSAEVAQQILLSFADGLDLTSAFVAWNSQSFRRPSRER